jgi:hypothetical protein
MSDATLLEMQKAALAIGHVEWGTTHALDADGHADHVRNSVEITSETFGQTGHQEMHGLYVKGGETVIGHTGTSPNSPTHARILTALWNGFVDEAATARKEPKP